MYNHISKIISERKKAAICLITETIGSTPRKIGSKMIVYAEGKIEGSIGGGDLEFFVIQKAHEIIESQIPKTYKFGLKTDFKMACGGNVSIFIEPVKLPDQLIIFGAGHIGRALANIAINYDFEITIVDERNGIFDDWNKNKFKIINANHEKIFDKLHFDNKTFVCSISHTHSYDKSIAGYCGAKETAFIGVIASKTKAIKIRKELVANNILSQKQADAIEMPMGLKMKCETPEEIAISILGRLIDIKNSDIDVRN